MTSRLHLPGLFEFMFYCYLSVPVPLMRENCALGSADAEQSLE